MISGIKEMIARCVERMSSGACATCSNRSVCPAGQWNQKVGVAGGDSGPSSNGVFFGMLVDLLRGLRRPARAERCFKREVEDAIEPILGSSEVSIDRVAHDLGMSRQTLYRRLKTEGTTFQEVLDAKRRQTAIRYLRLKRLSVKATAYRLGFSDPAAFSRAFKRWTGTSPRNFRRPAKSSG